MKMLAAAFAATAVLLPTTTARLGMQQQQQQQQPATTLAPVWASRNLFATLQPPSGSSFSVRVSERCGFVEIVGRHGGNGGDDDYRDGDQDHGDGSEEYFPVAQLRLHGIQEVDADGVALADRNVELLSHHLDFATATPAECVLRLTCQPFLPAFPCRRFPAY